MWDLRLCYVSIKSEELTPSQLFSFPFSSFSLLSPSLHTMNPQPIPTNTPISIFVFHTTPLIPQNSLFPLHPKLYNCLWILELFWILYIYIYISVVVFFVSPSVSTRNFEVILLLYNCASASNAMSLPPLLYIYIHIYCFVKKRLHACDH